MQPTVQERAKVLTLHVGFHMMLSLSIGAENGVYIPDANRVAQAFGYTPEQLASVPEGAHMGLSCGNPVATATLKEVLQRQLFQILKRLTTL